MALTVVAMTVHGSPAGALPVITGFTAVVDDVDRVTLTYSSTGGFIGYIEGVADGRPDVGYVAANGSTQVRTASWGRYEYRLVVGDSAGRRVSRTVVVDIAEPPSPVVGSSVANPHVVSNLTAPAAITVPLTVTGPTTGVQVKPPQPTAPFTVPVSGGAASFTVPSAALAVLQPGPSTWEMATCRRGTQATPAPRTFCGRASLFTVDRAGPQVDGAYREQLTVADGADGHPITWTGPGGMAFVRVDGQLLNGPGPYGAFGTPAATIPGSMLTPGPHNVVVIGCTAPSGRPSSRSNRRVAVIRSSSRPASRVTSPRTTSRSVPRSRAASTSRP